MCGFFCISVSRERGDKFRTSRHRLFVDADEHGQNERTRVSHDEFATVCNNFECVPRFVASKISRAGVGVAHKTQMDFKVSLLVFVVFEARIY